MLVTAEAQEDGLDAGAAAVGEVPAAEEIEVVAEGTEEVGLSSLTATPAGSSSRRGSRFHPCEVCQKVFTRPSALDTHMNIHNNLKPYLCKHPGCDAAFSVRSNMKRHRRTHSEEFHDNMEAAEKAVSATGPVFDTPIIAEESRPASSSSSKVVDLQWMPPNTVSRNARSKGKDKG
ncbi:hypothetical protein EV122DRAFT_207680 [Schizophyllum commune]|nr:hypothetical protein K523DRAFT_241302 [Schizophyllum commune Tattone D]